MAAPATSPVPRLEWIESPNRRESFLLTSADVTIGRRADANIVLTHPLVSRQHARLVREGQSFVLIDLNSSHGTFVNGSRVSRQPLRPRDRIRLGEQGIELVYQFESADPATDSTTVGLLEEAGIERAARRLATVIPEETAAHSELEKISCLLDFHYYFGKTFSAEKTFQHILKSALSISGAERAFILRKEGGAFIYAGGMDGAGSLLGQSDFRTSGTVVDRVVREGQPVFMTQGIHGDLAGSESIVAMNLRAVACLPLEAISNESEAAASIVGILYLDSRKHMHSLSGLDEKLLTRLAGEAGHVMEKLEMVVTLAEKRRIEQELATAEQTQRSLLPRTLPQYAPFRIRAFSRPTRQLGGDFYDFIAVANGLLTGVLADVSGKGIPAALLSSFTLGTLNMEFRSTPEPDVVLNEVNKLLHEKTPAHRFVTAFLFQLDAGGKGHFISAGHNPAYLFRAATGEVEQLTSGGIPLGMFPFATYSPTELRLHRGDLLVVYSDGLTEAENGAQQEFGEERLLSLIKAEAPRGADAMESTLLSELDRFTQGAMQTDDITFLLIENSGAAA